MLKKLSRTSRVGQGQHSLRSPPFVGHYSFCNRSGYVIFFVIGKLVLIQVIFFETQAYVHEFLDTTMVVVLLGYIFCSPEFL